MATHLAKELSKYYTREGNRVVFSNGMSLNQLAVDMCGRINGGAIDPSVISRNLSGVRVMTSKQVDVLADVLCLNDDERICLQEALNEDIQHKVQGLRSRYSLGLDTTASAYINMYSNELATIRLIIMRGDPQLGIRLAEGAANRALALAHSALPDEQRRKLYELSGLLLFEQGRAYREILPYSRVLPCTKGITKRIMVIARESKQEELEGLADFSLGDACYIAGYHNEAIDYFTRSWHRIEDPDYRLWGLRGLMLSWAYLGQASRFMELEATAQDLIAQGQYSKLDYVCTLIEGMARGQGQLGSLTAFDTLVHAQKYYAELKASKEKAPFRPIQFLRTKLELLLKLSPHGGNNLRESELDTIREAQEHGYTRHTHHMKELVTQLLK